MAFKRKGPKKSRKEISDIATGKLVGKVLELLKAAQSRGEELFWNRPFSGYGSSGHSIGQLLQRQYSHATQKPYRGINFILLALEAFSKGYQSNKWMTYNRMASLGGKLRGKQKSTPLLKYNESVYRFLEKDESGEEVERQRRVFYLAYDNVFNLDQMEGIEDVGEAEVSPLHGDYDVIAATESVLEKYEDKPPITHNGGDLAFYLPALDSIHLPPREKFDSVEAYYSVLFHELIHSTGHSSRLNREIGSTPVDSGGEVYGREELVAELGGMFLSASSGVSASVENSTAYIQHWINAIEADPEILIYAAKHGEAAANYILGIEN